MPLVPTVSLLQSGINENPRFFLLIFVCPGSLFNAIESIRLGQFGIVIKCRVGKTDASDVTHYMCHLTQSSMSPRKHQILKLNRAFLSLSEAKNSNLTHKYQKNLHALKLQIFVV